MNHLEEGHEEEVVLGELLEVSYGIVQGSSVEDCRHVVLVSSTGHVSKPDVDTLHVVFSRHYLSTHEYLYVKQNPDDRSLNLLLVGIGNLDH